MPSRQPRRCTAAELEQIADFVASGRVTQCPAMAAAPTSAVTMGRQPEAIDRALAQWEADGVRRRDALRRLVYGP